MTNFKDRKGLQNEFPELVESTRAEPGPMKAADDVEQATQSFPLLAADQNPQHESYAYD
ncbi:hypothetical protein E1B28_007867 [Marasmius oreades]|uniref:Uncharacterized protein n=1 Tax=Marasmius oreades TaxID=181124 RepID=A0A9P7UU78_9AGAR|nr:uncharacterized protein E1B28_007867 [Marasmius oreades]KAG7094263.1 hypothetical protein E1B28_007867 [Marasmius oreades]